MVDIDWPQPARVTGIAVVVDARFFLSKKEGKNLALFH
jgi:hypothetical protein